jgi:hypothetical protein
MRGHWNRHGEMLLLAVPLGAILFLLVTIIARRFW